MAAQLPLVLATEETLTPQDMDQGALAGSILVPSVPWVCLPSPLLSTYGPGSPLNWNLTLPLPGTHWVSWHVAVAIISRFSSLSGPGFPITKAMAWKGHALWSRSPCGGGVLSAEPDVQPPSREMLSTDDGCLGTWAGVLVCTAYSGLRCCLYFHRHRFHPLWWHVAICPYWMWLLGSLVQFTLDPKKFPSTHHIAAASVAKGSNLSSRCDCFLP